MSTRRYEYTPLAWRRQIRLLRLHPAASPDDPELSIDLLPVLLDAAPPFEALSYAWGDSLPKYEILCSSHRAEIGPSLYSALFHLRQLKLPSQSSWIWADAICINQSDIKEREAQVRMMSDIYSRASLTVIWLGEEDDHIAHAFDWLVAFETSRKPLMGSRTIAGPIDPVQSQALRAELYENNHSKPRNILRTVFGDQLTQDKAFEDIWVLLRRPWFMRKWVIQEVVKSTRLVFVAGERSMDHAYLNSWFQFLQLSPFSKQEFHLSYPGGLDLNTQDDTNAHSVYARGAILSRDDFRWGLPLSHLLAITAMFKCSEPHDQIIALLGIAAECSEFEDLVDYGISPDDLYRRLTCAHLNNGLNLRVLWSTHSMVPVDRRRKSSWIPNIEEMASRSAVSDISNPTRDWRRRMGNACGSTDIQATASGNKLLIRGRFVDVLARSGTDMTTSFPELKTSSGREFTAEHRRRQAILVNWLDECQAMAESAGYDERGFIDTLLIEDFFLDTPAELIVAAKKDFLTFRRIQKTLAAAPDELTWTKSLESMEWDITRSLRLIRQAIWLALFRRFGRTRYNRIGWMPLVVEKGDCICVFDGMELPYAVRPRQGQRAIYVLVGECYIPSLMNGEAMEIPGAESVIITLE